ncbi:efflux transporter outer membrane subunit [Rhizosaccharibacter radicis]|uniref:Efflux transporter outer membrane subunit n=1 Tax=Rhizosaccharibacter radicis TaxID=2782605 RepID=A0ABT1VXW6_9PROT|nr:efflux transporter outer membrane subunit [Acetobacteraceae bacterium KSS12]
MSSPAPRSAVRRAILLCAGTSLLPGLLSGCMVGPDYHRPAAQVTERFKEAPPPPDGWQRAQPHLAELPRGEWWRLYGDPVLNRLEEQIDVSNQSIKASEAAFRQARALIDEARANLFPTLSLGFSDTRSGSGGGAGRISTTTAGSSVGTTGLGGIGTGVGTGVGTGTSAVGTTVSVGGRASTTYQFQGSGSWDLDVWGQIRRQVESQVAAAQVSAAQLASARLSAQVDLATYYFEMRYQDSLQALLNRFVDAYAETERITRNEVSAGVAAPSDLLQAQTQLAQTRAQAVAVGIQRAQYEHAIAVLTGHAPADLSLSPAELTPHIPEVPVTVASLLLQRRPDIAQAERAMEEENALIGAAIAAFFPDISLSAAGGWAGDPLGSLIKVANRFWSLGASATEVLFNGGARTAEVRAARAAYDESVANYRQTVLTAFQGVEDELAALRILQQQAAAQEDAVKLANQSVQVALNQYQAGTTIYTTVITTQTTALSNAETALGIQQSRIVASVNLIDQLGGGWDASLLPSKNSLQTDNPLLPAFIQRDKN